MNKAFPLFFVGFCPTGIRITLIYKESYLESGEPKKSVVIRDVEVVMGLSQYLDFEAA